MQSVLLAIVQYSIIFLYKYSVLVALYKVSATEGVWCVSWHEKTHYDPFRVFAVSTSRKDKNY